jgi:hypothetical protein
MLTDETLHDEPSLTRLEKIRLNSKLARLMVVHAPRLMWHQIVNIGDYSADREERDSVAFDPVAVKASRYILENEIGSESFRLVTADRLQEIKDRRDLPPSTLARDM